MMGVCLRVFRFGWFDPFNCSILITDFTFGMALVIRSIGMIPLATIDIRNI